MGFLFSLLLLVIVLGIVYWIVTLLPLPEPFKKIATVLVLLICLVYLLGLHLLGLFARASIRILSAVPDRAIQEINESAGRISIRAPCAVHLARGARGNP